jgi:hypothetical protein
MWQMEDLLRAMNFDISELDGFVRSFAPDEKSVQDEKQWFIELVRKMKSENLESKGHLSELHELLFELNYLHNSLLNVTHNKAYTELYRIASPFIKEYLERSDRKTANDIETCLTALYGLLILKLKKEPISPETQEAMKTFSDLLASLSHHYKMMKLGEVNFLMN